MNTYYKNDNGNFIATTISVDDAITALVQSATKNAVDKVNDIITNFVVSRVDSAVSDSNIQERVKDHLATTNIGELVDNAISNAVRDYDYDGAIDNALDSIDIDEMVSEKVTDHLDSCSIQVRIN